MTSPAERAPAGNAVPTRPVPVRIIVSTIGLLLLTAVLLEVVVVAERVLVWIVIAAFFAVALAPAVQWTQQRVFRGKRRALATLLVFLAVVVVLLAVIAVFAIPLGREGAKFAGQLPDLIDQARNGQGVVGGFLDRTNALHYVQENQDRISSFASGLTTPAVGAVRSVATGIAGAVTIFVLAYLMVLEGPKVVNGSVALFPERHQERIRRVAADCGKSVTGYIIGNLAISVICGLLTFAFLEIFRVPFAGLIALFVAIVDLIPLVGATIGAVVAVIAAFVHSVPAGIAAIVFFVVYQQLENHLLQPVVFARTVKLNPLTVLISILVAVEIAGVLGALLAIPVASMLQVVARDLWNGRRGRPKQQPTVTEDEVPVGGNSA